MTAKKGAAGDTFLSDLEEGVRAILRDANASAAEKLKAIEAGAKVAMIRHRMTADDGDEAGGNFFDKAKRSRA